MAIYRGTGGAGDATTDATVSEVTEQAVIATNKASEAAASATQAANSASSASSSATAAASSAAATASDASEVAADADAAEAAKLAAEAAWVAAVMAEAGAETAATNAETAETNAASSASAASTSATNAANSASSAATSASNASTSASAAATSASSAAASATAAADNAGTATTQAAYAAISANSASNSATAASSSASAASTSATNAATSETNAATSAANASTSETNASASETAAASSATSASTSASNAATSATSASNSASAASTSATNAAASETAAAGSASAASASADAALAALDSFDDRYLGQKASAPTVDNDGNPLVTGALYFDTVDDAMKVWDGTQWLNAYASLSGALIANNNLSDLTNAATARTNLGLGTAATTDSTAYATAAQGALADAALPASSYTAADVLTKVKTVDGSGSGLDADLLDGQQGTYYAAASSLSNYLPLTGGAITGNVTFGDNNKATFGASSDLQIYHNGSYSAIQDVGTGALFIGADNYLDIGNANLSQTRARFYDNTVELRSGGAIKLATTATGIDVTGTATMDGLTVQGSLGEWSIDSQGAIQDFGFAGTNYIRASNASGGLRFGSGGYNNRLNIASNGDISFYEDTGTTAKFFWDASAESLGIGTFSYEKGVLNAERDITFPNATNSSADAWSNTNKSHIKLESNNSAVAIGVDSTANSRQAWIQAGHASPVFASAVDTSKLLLQPLGGNVGIGTSSPNQLLSINSTGSGERGISFDQSGSERAKLLYTNSTGAFVINNTTAGYTSFENNGAERMRIDSSGNMLVGKTAANLVTTGVEIDPNGILIATKNAGTVAYFNRLTNDGTILDFRKDSAPVGSIFSKDGAYSGIGNGDVGLLFLGVANDIRPWNPETNLAADNAIDLGHSDTRFKDLYLSGGVYLGGTGAANKLDDYEEGTWTPTVEGSTTSGTVVHSTRVGKYVKTGNSVTVSCRVIYNSLTGTGNLIITGLPFTSSASGSLFIGSVEFSEISHTGTPCVLVGVSDNKLKFETTQSAVTPTAVPVDAAGDIRITLTYFVD